MAKAADLDVDEVILDLEDAVSAARKEIARDTVQRALRDLRWRARTVAVRVNRGSAADLEMVSESLPDVVIVPKVESADELEGLPVPVEAQIESALGLVHCEGIAAARGVEALVLGPGDLAASLGVPEISIGAGPHIPYALVRMLVAARAFGRAAIDGPFARLNDEQGLRASAMRSQALGYDGKWCIHPAQIPTCNDVFTPTREEIERARRIAAVEGVARVDGEMVDEASRRIAESILARAGNDSSA